METEKEKVHSRQKFHSEGKRRLETLEKEDVLHHEFKVHSWSKKFISEEKCGLEKEEKEAVLSLFCSGFTSEKGSCMEAKEKEGSPFKKVPLLHFRLGSWK